MELHNLKPAEGSTHKSKRIGRGQGSGYGGTSTKGHKGAQSRSGYSQKIGHEGGQQPLQRRVPKYGFKNPFRKSYKPVNIETLEAVATENKIKAFNPEVFASNGLTKKKDLIKVLGNGEIKSAIEVTAHAFSASAKAAIEKAGGKAIVIGGEEKVEEKPAKKAAPKKVEAKKEVEKKEEPKKEEPKKEAKAEKKEEPKKEDSDNKEEKSQDS